MTDPEFLKAAVRHAPFRAGGWRGFIDPSWRTPERLADPLASMLALPHRTIKDEPDKQVFRVDDRGAGRVYVKHVSINIANVGAVRYLKRVLLRSRAVATLRVTEQLRRAGLAAPRVLLAAHMHKNHAAHDLLITRAAEGDTLKQILTDAGTDRQAMRDALRVTAQRVADFHRAGFIHGDLLTGNIILTPDRDNIVLLDNDRTRRPLIATGRERRRNIAQLATRIRRHGLWATRYFVRSYCDAAGFDHAASRRMQHRVIPTASRRRREHRRRRRSGRAAA